MGYKTRKSIIEGSRYHKDLELAYGLDGSAMPDGRPKYSAFQKPAPPESLQKAMASGMPEKAVENMGFDADAPADTPMDKYGPYRSEHVKTDTPMNFLGKMKNFNNKDAGQLAKAAAMGPIGLAFMKTETPMSKVLGEAKVIREKKDNLVNVTEEYKTKGNKPTRDHIAKGGEVFKDSVTGQITLRRDA